MGSVAQITQLRGWERRGRGGEDNAHTRDFDKEIPVRRSGQALLDLKVHSTRAVRALDVEPHPEVDLPIHLVLLRPVRAGPERSPCFV